MHPEKRFSRRLTLSYLGRLRGEAMAISKQDKLYGKLIVDFANSESTDEAIIKLIDNTNLAFRFTLDFKEKATRDIFPTIELYKADFPKWDEDLMSLFAQEEKALSFLNNELQPLGVKFCGYDCASESLLLKKVKIEDDEKGHEIDVLPVGEPFWLHVDEIKEKFDSLSYRGSIPEGSDGYIDIEVVVEEIHDLMRVGVELREKKEQFSEKEEVERLENQGGDYKNLLEAHRLIKTIKGGIRKTLESVWNDKTISKGGLFSAIVSEYNKHKIARHVHISEDGTLKITPQGYEQLLLHVENLRVEPLVDIFARWRNVIYYSMVEFFLTPENLNHLKRCEWCKSFYIAKALRTSKYCSDPCRLKFHNEKRIKSGEAAKYKQKKRREGAKESYY